MTRGARLAVSATVIGLAIYVAFVRMGAHPVPGDGSPPGIAPDSLFAAHYRQFVGGRLLDIYGSFYPNFVYAVRAVWDGGQGLFWNPLQNCGQPFFAMVHTALLYPPHTLSLLLGADLALHVIPCLNLVVAGLFAFLLCRELGAGTMGALCGAVAFELGNSAMEVVGAHPHVAGSYVWLPAALLCCERTLKAPVASNVAGLAVVLTLDLFAGFPQSSMYIYQLVAFRVAWEFASRRVVRPAAVLVAIGLGLVLAPLLAAVHLVPALEVVRASVRNAPLPPGEVGGELGFLAWPDYLRAIQLRATLDQPLVLVPLMFAGAAVLRRATRRYALFYLVAGFACFLLGLGPVTPLFDWYTTLPLASLFRYPQRFLWLAGFCLSVLMGLGVDAVLSADRAAERRTALIGGALMVSVALGFHLLAPDGLRPLELALAATALVATAGVVLAPALRWWAGVIVLAALVVNLVAVPVGAWTYLIISGRPFLFSHASVFTRLRARMTAQDRVYLSFGMPFASKFGLTPKTASLFDVPSLNDYEPLTTQRYAEYVQKLRTGGGIEGFFSGYVPGNMTSGFNRRLLDRAAGRYILAETAIDQTAAVIQPPPPLLEDGDGTRLYENPHALPRARYVPHVEVVEAPDALLERLASGMDDAREVALVEAPLPSGFTGVAGGVATGTAEFLSNEPERLVLRVRAPARGFLVLADQYFPGWEATVDGVAQPIVRADYVFRLVEVPAGVSVVEFRYAPPSLRLGGFLSALALCGISAALVPSIARRRARGSPTRRRSGSHASSYQAPPAG